MELAEIEEKVGAIEAGTGPDFLYALLAAYGLPQSSISRLRSGTYDKAPGEDEVLWKGKVYFRFADVDGDELLRIIDAAGKDEAILGLLPRFLIVRNDERILAQDQSTGSTLDIGADALAANFSFFLPWAGIEKTQLENLSYADVKAAEKMARLYDEIVRKNEFEDADAIHDLNVFFSRLLFCFFAEDTGVFELGSFTNAVGSMTRESGEDTNRFLDQLFEVLDTELDARQGLPEHLRGFGYVNGKLFARRSPAPKFTAKARRLILECATLDWSRISPDIFGSMMQAVVRRDDRKKLGMHYTSVENIMKVVRPLFLDDLEEALAGADTVQKLDRLLERISTIQLFDPACGSGNFLVISYKELRSLEHQILQRIIELEPSRRGLFSISAIKLESFFGIEIEDFPHEIAILSLWLAKHQMDLEFEELFGAEIPLIPLRESAQIVCGNATRLDWSTVCDPERSETYVLGNPPYLGGKLQGAPQKADFENYFGTAKYPRNTDYIALWFFKGAEYVSNSDATLAFVSTNSISQGEQLGLIWPRLIDSGVRISFAHQSFPWTNQARGKAGVSCVIIGLVGEGTKPKNDLYGSGGRRHVVGINPYLRAGTSHAIVAAQRTAPPGLPPMAFGNMPRDGGHLILTPAEAEALVGQHPGAAKYVRRYGGSEELLHDKWRACLWIRDEDKGEALAIPAIAERVGQVKRFRASSGSQGARDFADRAHRFYHRPHKETPAILVPATSSERRDYIPLGFVGGETIISNLAYAVYDAEPWLFGLLHSRMHMVWVQAVGGRLESRYRYSAALVYNTFPVPALSEREKVALRGGAVDVLGAREQFPDRTLAELYDPEQMPDAIRQAHARLDAGVEGLYRDRAFVSDDDRLELLLEMHQERVTETEGIPANA
jgi:type I restriction-modification system DNA methylase subunit